MWRNMWLHACPSSSSYTGKIVKGRNMYLQSSPSSSSYTGKIERERNMCGGICTFNPAPLSLPSPGLRKRRIRRCKKLSYFLHAPFLVKLPPSRYLIRKSKSGIW